MNMPKAFARVLIRALDASPVCEAPSSAELLPVELFPADVGVHVTAGTSKVESNVWFPNPTLMHAPPLFGSNLADGVALL